MKEIFALMISVLLASSASGVEEGSERYWKYAELVYAIDKNNFSHLEKLETPLTKCGFGPGEEGNGCLRRILDSRQGCKNEVLLALKQGCAMSGDNECTAPPQAADASILYVGPRIHLAFSPDGNTITIISLLCGSD